MKKKPYIDNNSIRTFSKDIDPFDLVWHRDKEDRIIKVIEGSRWKLQFDNELPFLLEEGKEYSIKKMTIHRILKGDGDLIIDINKI